MQSNLQQIKILVLRPEIKAQKTCIYYASQGVKSYRLPMLSIKPIKPNLSQNTVDKFNHYVFTSSLAVNEFFKYCPTNNLASYWAVGKATQAALKNNNINAVVAPKTINQTKKTLSIEDTWQILKPQLKPKDNVLLVSGIGGRRFLSLKLIKNNIAYKKLPLYKRHPLIHPKQSLETALNFCNIILFHSASILHSFIANLNNINIKLQGFCYTMPVVVISDTIAKLAYRYGFNNVFISNGSSDADCFKAIICATKNYYEQ